MARNEIQDGDQKLSRKKNQTHNTDTERQMVRERMEKTECTGE
jgi:hypothetical protein